MTERANNKNYGISFIIPVYNSAKYLNKCLDSILEMDDNIIKKEIICIDDGSSDNSREILESYKEKYSNIRIICQDNKGSGVARNRGIEVAEGTFLWFVDSDDVVLVGSIYLKKLLDLAQKYDVNIIQGLISIYDMIEKKSSLGANVLFSPDYIVDGRALEKENNTDKIIKGEIAESRVYFQKYSLKPQHHRSIYRRSFILKNDIKFLETNYLEDLYWEWQVMLKEKNTKILETNLLFYQYNLAREDSLTAINNCLDSIYSRIYELNKIISWIKENYELTCYSPETINIYLRLRNCIGEMIVSTLSLFSKAEKKENYHKIEKFLNEEILNFLDYYLKSYNVAEHFENIKSLNLEKINNRNSEMSVSFIIPIYNTEKYLERCIESVIKVDVEKEIIIINDGSTDKSLEITANFQKKYKDQKIIIIDQKNEGLSVSRNIGLLLARNNYISFIDSDDYIEAEKFKEALKETFENDLEIGITLYNVVADVNYSDYHFKNEKPDKIMSGNKYMDYLDAGGFAPTVWDDIYKREFLLKNDLFFKPKLLYEDNMFTINSILLAKKLKYINIKYYNYTIDREGGITTQKIDKKNVDDMEYSANYILQKFKENGHMFLFTRGLALKRYAEKMKKYI